MLHAGDYLFLSFALLLIGTVGVIARRNVLIRIFSIELILLAASINFVTFERLYTDSKGQIFTIFLVVTGAAQIIVALAIGAAVFRQAIDRSALDAGNIENHQNIQHLP